MVGKKEERRRGRVDIYSLLSPEMTVGVVEKERRKKERREE